MFKKFNIIPKWVVFLIDLLVCYFTFIFSHYLKNDFSIEGFDIHTNSGAILLWLIVLGISFIAFKTYSGIVRYTGLPDLLKIIYSVLTAIAVLFITSLFGTFFKAGVYFSATSLVVSFFTTTFFLIFYRVFVKLIFSYVNKRKAEKRNVLIYGGGIDGLAIKRMIENNKDTRKSTIVAFIDDDFQKAGQTIEGVKVFHIRDFQEVVLAQDVDEVILANASLSIDKKNKITDFCSTHGVKVLYMKPVDEWMEGQLDRKEIRTVDIESLFDNETLPEFPSVVKEQLRNSTILVTGAAGSIGSEILRILLSCNTKKIILVDNAESALYLLYKELSCVAGKTELVLHFGDICQQAQIQKLLAEHTPDIIFHAAAYKQVPILEKSISTAIKNNIVGTKMIADLAYENKVKKFIFLSNERAVHPNNVLHFTKRICEVYLSWLSEQSACQTDFVTIRFGNVLATSGSVSSIFKSQIQAGGPITITHPDIARTFINVNDCSRLILEIACLPNSSRIYMINMGKAISIISLAEKMISLQGLEAGNEIDIKTIGLRPGEKLYDELWSEEETIELLGNERIRKVVKPYAYGNFNSSSLDNLISMVQNNSDDERLLAMMKDMIPEFTIMHQ